MFPPLSLQTDMQSSAHHSVRLERHRLQIEAYTRNTMDPEMMANHAALLETAREMETIQVGKRADAANGGSAAMSDEFDAGVDIGYQANVTVGTPGQIFGMIPDSEPLHVFTSKFAS